MFNTHKLPQIPYPSNTNGCILNNITQSVTVVCICYIRKSEWTSLFFAYCECQLDDKKPTTLRLNGFFRTLTLSFKFSVVNHIFQQRSFHGRGQSYLLHNLHNASSLTINSTPSKMPPQDDRCSQETKNRVQKFLENVM